MQLTADLAVHACDLARATGQDDTLDPGAVALLLRWTDANADLLAGSGMYRSVRLSCEWPRICWTTRMLRPRSSRKVAAV